MGFDQFHKSGGGFTGKNGKKLEGLGGEDDMASQGGGQLSFISKFKLKFRIWRLARNLGGPMLLGLGRGEEWGRAHHLEGRV